MAKKPMSMMAKTAKEDAKMDRPELFTIRSDQDLWDALDELQVSTRPVRSRSEIVRDLIFKAAAEIKKRRRRKTSP